VDAFTRSYIETALWSSNDESDDSGGEPMDRNYSADDLAPDTLASIIADCEAFQRDNADDLAPYKLETAGHDFWLTRNHHGAGYWDGDYAEPHATRLTDASHAYGNVDLYIGDDGMIHGS